MKISRWLLILSICFSCTSREDMMDKCIGEEDWDGILSLYEKADSLRGRDIICVNIALAAENRLAEDAFSYFQTGPFCLIPEWNRHAVEGAAMSDMMYQAGYIALAQRMAFESFVLSEPESGDRMMKRLVQTNLIYEDWPVAEKYICYLENRNGPFKRWAHAQRRFLYNPEALEADSEYGNKRRCIPEKNFIIYNEGFTEEFKEIIRTNTEHRNTVDILGVYYLLGLDFDNFKSFLDEFYGTEALKSLPKSFAEAACFLSENEPGYWKRVGVSKEVYNRYRNFKSCLGAGVSMKKFNDTFWMYVMKMNRR